VWQDLNSHDFALLGTNVEIEMNEDEKFGTIFEPNEADDVNEYLQHLSIKEVRIFI